MSPEVLSRKLAMLRACLSDKLGKSLERAAGLRNVLVHLYADLDMEILAASVEPALNDFGEFLKLWTDSSPERKPPWVRQWPAPKVPSIQETCFRTSPTTKVSNKWPSS